MVEAPTSEKRLIAFMDWGLEASFNPRKLLISAVRDPIKALRRNGRKVKRLLVSNGFLLHYKISINDRTVGGCASCFGDFTAYYAGIPLVDHPGVKDEEVVIVHVPK